MQKGVDSFIVQFIKTQEDRALLGQFVWAYFSRIVRVCGRVGCSCNGGTGAPRNVLAAPTVPGAEYAARLLRAVATPGTAGGSTAVAPRCDCALPPLYLQWNGHSVTVVGVRRRGGDAAPGPPAFHLLVFCPQRRGAPAGRACRDEGGDAAGRRYPALELPASRLLAQDCQLLLTTGRTLTAAERGRRKQCTKNVGFLDAVAAR